MVVSYHQNVGQNHNLLIATKTFRNVSDFKYLETTLTNHIYIHEQINSRLIFGSVRYHSVQNLLSSDFPSKNLKIKIYKFIMQPLVLYGCKTWSLPVREEHRLNAF